MENKDGWPAEVVLFRPLERVKQVVRFLFDQMHYDVPERGAATMLDESLYGTNE